MRYFRHSMVFKVLFWVVYRGYLNDFRGFESIFLVIWRLQDYFGHFVGYFGYCGCLKIFWLF